MEGRKKEKKIIKEVSKLKYASLQVKRKSDVTDWIECPWNFYVKAIITYVTICSNKENKAKWGQESRTLVQ